MYLRLEVKWERSTVENVSQYYKRNYSILWVVNECIDFIEVQDFQEKVGGVQRSKRRVQRWTSTHTTFP